MDFLGGDLTGKKKKRLPKGNLKPENCPAKLEVSVRFKSGDVFFGKNITKKKEGGGWVKGVNPLQTVSMSDDLSKADH